MKIGQVATAVADTQYMLNFVTQLIKEGLTSIPRLKRIMNFKKTQKREKSWKISNQLQTRPLFIDNR